VSNADLVRDFYAAVTGWRPDPVEMGGYSDYSMLAADGECVAGVCHARGINADIPPQWLIYVNVENLDRSIAECTNRGGGIVSQPRDVMGGRMCVIRDPAGAVCALYQASGCGHC
jgi:predicted enzyme related to lactoylglutathione lyase